MRRCFKNGNGMANPCPVACHDADGWAARLAKFTKSDL
ncbi:hypothetical protein EJK54_1450 [Moraxella catarrhalis]|uniref:Uncharacterized protein n=1 Tax=Moraxella catarrhalis TaxID=480 RepID=A0ABY0BJ12_MORCA|nr:hypothetical protein EJK54_1450 [Moraxella catarrhalis]